MSKLKELLESSVLTDETKETLQEAFDVAVEAAAAEKVEESRKELVALIPEMIEEAISNELEEIAVEVREAREQEVLWAEKFAEFKENYAAKVDEMLQLMVAESVAEEIDELREDIELAKKHRFAIAVTEAFGDTYSRMFGESDVSLYDELTEAKKELETYRRKEKLDSLLEGIEGRKRDVLESILESVDVDRMEAKFESVKAIVLTESNKPEGDDKVITEGDDSAEETPEGTVVLEDVELEEGNDAKLDERQQYILNAAMKLAKSR